VSSDSRWLAADGFSGATLGWGTERILLVEVAVGQEIRVELLWPARSWKFLVLGSLSLLIGCGRTTLGYGRSQTDDARIDRGAIIDVEGDQGTLGEGSAGWDRSGRADSCLPYPVGELEGGYLGSWWGTWGCASMTENISGLLEITLSHTASQDAFDVKGAMNGIAGMTVPFTSSVRGTLSCSSLQATLADIDIEKGSYQATGTLIGTLVPPRPASFEGGTFAIKGSQGACSGSGTWSARFHNY
jgi:hypothetical protein